MPTTNQLGYEILNEKISKKIFGKNYKKTNYDQSKINGILNEMRNFNVKFPIFNPHCCDLEDINLPPLAGDNIQEHFDNISKELSEDIENRVNTFLRKGISLKVPNPQYEILKENTMKWIRISYSGISFHDEILEDIFIYDCETFVKGSLFAHPIIATAVSSEAYYIWIHEDIFNLDGEYIPILPNIGRNKIVIAHNANYDRRRVKESYHLDDNNFWLDTMSMHINIAGLSSAQRFYFVNNGATKKNKYSFEPQWATSGSMNSLVDCYNHHVYMGRLSKDDKKIRDAFVEATSLKEIHDDLINLVSYAIRDVRLTFELAEVLIPKYLQANPSRTTLVSHGVLMRSFLPIAKNWNIWLNRCETLWNECHDKQTEILSELALNVFQAYQDQELDIESDPWLSQLDWSMNTRLKKDGTPLSKWYGIPKWLRDVSEIKFGQLEITGITTKTRLSHLLLRLKWNDRPIQYFNDLGWCTMNHELCEFERIPHPKTEGANVGTLLNKDYYNEMEEGILTSDLSQAKELLDLSINVSYWTSVRSRVLEEYYENPDGFDVISPAVVPHNTITNRAGCNLWFTVPDPKKDKIGSEVKTQVQAPDGYVFVQSDFDQQESVIASIFADSYHKLLGSTPFSNAILVGAKENGTDIHSMTAKAIGIPRSVAKNCGYAMLYGSGAKTLANTIRRGNKSISMDDAMILAKKLIEVKKGKKQSKYDMEFFGGTDSHAYNEMTRIANMQIPINPLSRTKMSTALRPSNVGNEFYTMRQNWCIQSTGTAMLHAFITGMEYLIKKYNLNAKFCISIHDSITYLCKESDAEFLTACYQVAHAWSWAWLRSNYDLYELPAAATWFSSVEIDNIMRKSATTDVVTISNPIPKPNGKAYSLEQILPQFEKF